MKHQLTLIDKERELRSLILQAETHKKQIRRVIRQITEHYKHGKITHEEYKTRIQEAFGQQTPTALIKHYDTCIKQYQQELKQNKQLTTQQKTNTPLYLIAFLLLIGGIVFSNTDFTGFFIAEGTPHKTTVNLITNEDITYTLPQPIEGKITALAISGTIEGDGEVQIYLENIDNLLYDSTKKEAKKGLFGKLTGLVTAPTNQTPQNKLQLYDEDRNILEAEETTTKTSLVTKPTTILQIQKITFQNLKGKKLGISTKARGIVAPQGKKFNTIYSFDTTELTFDEATAQITATGNELYKCNIWDFSLSICLSTWEQFTTIEQTKAYKITLPKGTIAFAEANTINTTTSKKPQTFPLQPLTVAVKQFNLGEIAKFDILVKNTQKTTTPAQAQIQLTNNKTTIANFNSTKENITQNQPKALLAYWDTTNTESGTYEGTLKLIANKETKEYPIKVIVTEKTIHTEIIGITGKVVTKTQEQPKKNQKKKTFIAECKDACTLEGLNKTPHKLIIIIKDALLNLTNIDYTIKTNGTNITINKTKIKFQLDQKQHKKKIKKLKIDKTKITHRDEKKKIHKIQRHASKNITDGGLGWERECIDSICKHTIYQNVEHYHKEDSNFGAIKNALTDQNCAIDEELCIKSKKHKISFKEKATQEATINLTINNATISFTPLQLRHSMGEEQTILSSANPVTGEGTDNIFTYNNIFGQGINMKLTYLADQIKEEIILTDNSFLGNIPLTNTTNTTITIDYIVTKSPELQWKIGNVIQTPLAIDEQIQTPQALQLQDTKGTKFILPKPIAYSGKETQPLSYSLTQTDKQEILSIEIPLTYLQTTPYPIIIDPTIVLDYASVLFDGYVTSDISGGSYTRASSPDPVFVGQTDQGGPFDTYRADIDWDISSVPTNAFVTQLTLDLYVKQIGNPDTTIYVNQMSGNSTTYPDDDSGNIDFYTDMQDTNYASIMLGGAQAYEAIDFTADQSLLDFHNQLENKSTWFSVGLSTDESGSGGATPSKFTGATSGNPDEIPQLTIVYDLPPPTITLNAPANNSYYSAFINETLNATIKDNEPTIQEVIYYGGTTLPPRAEDILFIQYNVTNGTQLAVNWTTEVYKADGDTQLLLHFDNRSEFGENDTIVFDFSNQTNNGTITDAGGLLNLQETDGKLGGAVNFQPIPGDGGKSNITFGDQDELIGANHTYMMWLKIKNQAEAATIFTKYNADENEGMKVNYSNAGATLGITTDTKMVEIKNFFDIDQYTHLAITIDTVGEMKVYKNGIFNSSTTGHEITPNTIPFDIVFTDESTPIPIDVADLDEFVILNRTLSAWEILDAYRLKGGVYYWYVNATDASGKPTGMNMSEIRKLTINHPPEITLNLPLNNTLFAGVGAIILNSTIIERELDTVIVEIFGGNTTTPDMEDLLYKNISVANGTTILYNWTAPILKALPETALLYHFDNRSEFGEHATSIYDFTGLGHTGTIQGDGLINLSNEIFAGHLELDGTGDRVLVSNCGYECIQLRDATFIMWLNPNDESTIGGLTGSLATVASLGFGIYKNTDDLAVVGDGNVGVADVDFFTGETGNWIHLAATTLANGTSKIYKNGVLQETGVINAIFNVFIFGWSYWVGEVDAVQASFLFDGSIDEFTIINRTLSDAEIQERYQLGNGTYYWFVNATDNFSIGHNTQSQTRQFVISDTVRITAAEINESTPVESNTFVKVNASIESEVNTLNTTYVTATPPLSNEFNITLHQNGNEHFNVTVKLNESGNWTFTFHANDSEGNEATAVKAIEQSATGYPYITVAWNGSDSFGYRGKDIHAISGPSYFYTNISRPEIALGLSDDGLSVATPIGFDFKFYNNLSATHIRICNNGFISFDVSIDSCPFNNVALGTDGDPEEIAAVFWGDLAEGGDLYNETRGTAPNRIFIVQWDRNFFGGGSTDRIDAQIVLYENSSDIQFNYLDTVSSTSGSLGAGASIGIENRGSDFFIQRSLNQAILYNSYALRFYYPNLANTTAVVTTPNPANTTDTLNCTFTVTDIDTEEGLSANITFYNRSTDGIHFTVYESYNISVTNGTEFTQDMTATSQVKNEVWKCGIVPFDGIKDGTPRNSSTVTIVNSVPGTPTLGGPVDNYQTTELALNFNWTNITDADGDPVNYTFNLTCYSTAGGGCTAPGDDRIFNITTNSTSSDGDLNFRIDDGFYYNWTVLAHDGTNQSTYAQARTFNISVLVAISFINGSNVDFHTLGLGLSNRTIESVEDSGPNAFELQNDGNSFIEVNITAIGSDLFSASPIPSDAFLFKGTVPIAAPIPTPINQTRSISSYTNVTRTNQTVLAGFNYSDATDEALVHVKITVPLDEPSGTKGATLVLTGYYFGGRT